MAPHDTIAVAVRLFAVWLALHVVRELFFYFEFNRPQESSAPFIALAVIIITALLVLVLWFFPRSIARGLLASSRTQAGPAASADTWLAMGCALIGLWLLGSALPALIRNSALLLMYRSPAVDTSNLRYGLFYYLGELVIAVWLILGASGFRRIFWWARNAGRTHDGDHQTADK
jgi:hypothetical protein